MPATTPSDTSARKRLIARLTPALVALSVAAPLLVLVAVLLVRLGMVELAVGYDLLTWRVARVLAWIGVAAGLIAAVAALASRTRVLPAATALCIAGATVGAFGFQATRFARDWPLDVSTNTDEAPGFSALAAFHGAGAAPADTASCSTAAAIPSQLAAQTVGGALVDAGFPVVRASAFQVEGVHEAAWFGRAFDAVIRIRPGRTDVRVAARGERPDGGATCRLAAKIAANLRP